jgi:hypothetical protein
MSRRSAHGHRGHAAAHRGDGGRPTSAARPTSRAQPASSPSGTIHARPDLPATSPPVPGHVPAKQVPAERIPAERIPAERIPAEQVPAEQVPTEHALAEHVPQEPTEPVHDSTAGSSPEGKLDAVGDDRPLASGPGPAGNSAPHGDTAPSPVFAPRGGPAPFDGTGPNGSPQLHAGPQPNGGPGPNGGPQPNGQLLPSGATAAQLRRFIKSRAYIPMHELRRRFAIDGGDDDVTAVEVASGRVFVGLPAREGRLLGELLRGGEVGYELSLDPASPIVIGLYPMRPVPRP